MVSLAALVAVFAVVCPAATGPVTAASVATGPAGAGPAGAASAVSGPAVAGPASAVSAGGVLVRTVADDLAGTERVSIRAAGRAPVPVDPAVAEGIRSGTPVRVEGGIVTAAQSASADSGVLGTHHVTIVPVYWATSSVPGGQPGTGALATAGRAVDGYYNTVSTGRIRVAVDRVTAWKRIASPIAADGCVNVDTLETAARKIAGSLGGSGRAHLVVYFPRVAKCGWAGMATLGAGLSGDGVIWLNGYDELQVFGHEIGHNLGLRHSNGAACYDDAAHHNRVPLSDYCDVSPYQDAYDIMGNRATGNLSAFHLGELGLLPAAGSRRLLSTATVTLAPIASRAGLRQVVVPMGRRTYYVEYRTSAGLDASVDAGVVVRFTDTSVPYDYYGETQLVYFGQSEDGVDRVGLAAGESWSGGGWGIAVDAATGTAATVTITQTPDTAAPVVSPKPRTVLRRGAVSTTALPVTVMWGVSDRHDITGLRIARRLSGDTAAPAYAKLSPWDRAYAAAARPGRANTWLIQATDELGNTGITAGAPTTATLNTQNSRPAKSYQGAWKTERNGSYLGGSEQITTARNAKASFAVTGRSIGWVATKDATRGSAAVYLDGRRVATVNLHASRRSTRQLVYVFTWASAGRHTITVVNLATKGHAKIGVDALAALS